MKLSVWMSAAPALAIVLCAADGFTPHLLAQASSPKPAGTVDFQRAVRPILSDNCYRCHGPDKATRLADLRLDTKEGAFGSRKNGTPIVPGKLEDSLVYQRITAPTAARRMPPEYAHKDAEREANRHDRALDSGRRTMEGPLGLYTAGAHGAASGEVQGVGEESDRSVHPGEA